MKEKPNEAKLKVIVADIQSEVGKHRNRVTKAASANNAAFDAYPSAGPKDKSDNIGIIVDDQFCVKDLMAVSKISPLDGLHWLQIKSYDVFKEFLDQRGLPAYISFDGDLGVKNKDGLACAKLFIERARKDKVKDLPRWECHSPTVTSKEAIEYLLHGY